MVGQYFKAELHQTPAMPNCRMRNIKKRERGMVNALILDIPH
jgi:hypothetical protein